MNDCRRVTISAGDGYTLSASVFEPAGEPLAVLILSAGTAVPQRVFARFASYCAGRGLLTITYDYRGIGASAPAHLRDFPARMRDWALLDLAAVLDWARTQHAGPPLLYAGHSFGGHAFGLIESNTAFKRALFIATMSGYWRDFAPGEGMRVYLLMNLLAPPILHTVGYLPGRLGLGESMSAGIFREWAGWCRKKNYFFDDPTFPETRNFAGFTGQIRSLAMEDDPWTTPAAVTGLVSRYSSADVSYVRYHPHALHADRIGHFGFFRPQFRETLWRENIDWLVCGLD